MNPLDKENWKELEEGFVKYMAYVASSGMHGPDLYAAASQYWKPEVEKLLASQESQVRKSCAEISRNNKRLTDNCICGDDGSHYFCDKSFNQACDDIARSIEQGNKE